MAKSIWKRVVDAGLKSAYSERGNDKLVALIVCAIGMAYVPLESHNVVGNNSIKNAYNIMKKIAKQLPEGKQYIFGISFLQYFKDTWMKEDGNFPPTEWNFFLHKGATTNNFNEGYNNR